MVEAKVGSQIEKTPNSRGLLMARAAEALAGLGFEKEKSSYIVFKLEEIASKLQALSRFSPEVRNMTTAPLLRLKRISEVDYREGDAFLVLKNKSYSMHQGEENLPVRIDLGVIMGPQALDGSVRMDTVALADIPFKSNEFVLPDYFMVAMRYVDTKESNVLPLDFYSEVEK